MAILLTVDGEQRDLGFYPHADAIHEAIGGYFDLVHLLPGHEWTMAYVDDEGLLKHLPVNTLVSLMAGQLIVGPAVLFTAEEEKEDMKA